MKLSDAQKLELLEAIRQDIKSYLSEQAPAPAQGAPIAPTPGAPPAAPATQAPQVTPDQTADLLSDLGNLEAGAPAVEYTLEQLVDSLNKIRGGRSFDDQDVYQQLETAFNAIDPASKETLRNVIEQIATIVTPVDGQQPPAEQQPQQQAPTDTTGQAGAQMAAPAAGASATAAPVGENPPA